MMSEIGNAKLDRRRSDLMKAFESAKSAKEMLKVFHKLEKLFPESLLGMECWTLAQQFSSEGKDPEKALSFGKRALKTLIETEKEYTKDFGPDIQPWSMIMANVLTILGKACCELGRFEESLSYLNWSIRNLSKLELDKSCPAEEVLPGILVTEIELFKLKVVMERKEEVVAHLTKILEVKEKIFEKDCLEVAESVKDVSSAYIVVEKNKEALPFCLRAVELYTKHFGQDSVEVARLRRNLGFIYTGLEEYEKVIEQYQLAHNVLKGEEDCGEYLMSISDMLMRLGRNEEALDVLKEVVSDAAGNECEQAVAFVFMAKAFVRLGKFADAKNYMKLALRVFDKKRMDPGTVATWLGRMAYLYEEMKDFDTAISMMLRLLTMSNIPQEILREYSTRHAELILRKEKVVEGQGPIEEDELDEAFALLQLIKEDIGILVEDSPTTDAPKNT